MFLEFPKRRHAATLLSVLPFQHSVFLSALPVSVVWNPVEMTGGEEKAARVQEKRRKQNKHTQSL